MKRNYTDIHSKFYGVGKGRVYNLKGSLRDPSTLWPPPQIAHPLRLVTYKSEMEPTPQVRTTARHNVAEGLTSTFVGVDVGLIQERAIANIRKKIVYKTNDELDRMDIEYLKAYAKVCRDIASDSISHDTSSIGEVCVLSIYLLYLFILNWTFCYITSMYDIMLFWYITINTLRKCLLVAVFSNVKWT